MGLRVDGVPMILRTAQSEAAGTVNCGLWRSRDLHARSTQFGPQDALRSGPWRDGGPGRGSRDAAESRRSEVVLDVALRGRSGKRTDFDSRQLRELPNRGPCGDCRGNPSPGHSSSSPRPGRGRRAEAKSPPALRIHSHCAGGPPKVRVLRRSEDRRGVTLARTRVRTRCPVRGVCRERSRIARSAVEILSLGSEPGAETSPSPPWRGHNGSRNELEPTPTLGKNESELREASPRAEEAREARGEGTPQGRA